MNTELKARKAITGRRQRQQKSQRSRLSRSAAEIDSSSDTNIQAKARKAIVQNRQQAEHIQESMLGRSVAEVGVPIELNAIKEEIRQLVEQGLLSRHQRISSAFEYIPAREWVSFELELERNDFLLRDRISDLIPLERWIND